MDRYRTEIFWSEEDEAFLARVPELPGCWSHGETRIEAATQIGDAIEAWIEAATSAGNPVPPPILYTTH